MIKMQCLNLSFLLFSLFFKISLFFCVTYTTHLSEKEFNPAHIFDS